MTQGYKTYFFRVAGFLFGASLPGGTDPVKLLPSFMPFTAVREDADDPLFVTAFQDGQESAWPGDGLQVIETMSNDMGYATLSTAGDRYLVELRAMSGASSVCRMLADKTFSEVRIMAGVDGQWAGQAFSSLLRIAFSQAVLLRGAVSVHASAVCCGGSAYLFTGKSGTGKSTHSALWLRHVPGTALLNDDNPVLRLEGDGVMAYGTPWSGKTPCYRNEGYPAAGLVRLSQAPENRFFRKTDVDAFSVLLPGCSAIRKDRMLYDCLCDTLAAMSSKIRAGILECRPDREAVEVCRKGLGLTAPEDASAEETMETEQKNINFQI